MEGRAHHNNLKVREERENVVEDQDVEREGEEGGQIVGKEGWMEGGKVRD